MLKIYALQARRLCKETDEDKRNLTFQHFKLGRHFLERPEEVSFDQFVHWLEQENQKAVVKVRTKAARIFAHGRPHLSKAERTAKKNPKRAASAQLIRSDAIAAVA